MKTMATTTTIFMAATSSLFFHGRCWAFTILSRPRIFHSIAEDIYDDAVSFVSNTKTLSSVAVPPAPLSFLPHGRYALDIHCGDGDTTAMLRRSCPNLHVVGIEKDPILWRQARLRYPNLFFYYGNVLHMDVFSNSADVIQVPFKDFRPESRLLIHKLGSMLTKDGEIRIVDHDTMKIILRFHKSDILDDD